MNDKNTIDNELPIPDESDVSATQSRSKKKKIIIISAFTALVVLGAVSWFILYGIPEKIVNPMFSQTKQDDIIGMYGSTQSYIFYPIDHDLDIMSEKEYLDLDRSIYYKVGAETFAANEADPADLDPDILFFLNYFDLAIAGDYESYNKLFTDNYYKSNEPYYSFTQQMIYDVHLEKLSEDTEDGNDVYYYNVSYRIHRNNGTFRNDIDSDSAKTLYYKLIDFDGTVLIDYITYYVS